MTQLLKIILNPCRIIHAGSHRQKKLTKLMKLQSVIFAKETIFTIHALPVRSLRLLSMSTMFR